MPRMGNLERFESKVTCDGLQMPHMKDRCTSWGLKPNKYTKRAMFSLSGNSISASSAAWQLQVGPIPNGLQVNHHCDNSLCTRISHLYLGVSKQNSKDRDDRGRNYESNKTHCPKEHPYDEVNTRRYRTARYCRTCNSAYNKEYYRRNKSK